MVIGTGYYAMTLNLISKMASRYNSLAVMYREKMIYVNKFMIQKDLPKELRNKVRKYLEFVWESKKKVKIEPEEALKMVG